MDATPHTASARTCSRRREPRSTRPRPSSHPLASLRIASLLLLWAIPAAGQLLAGAPHSAQAVRERLARVDSADVSRACGNLDRPWAYRGPAGRHVTLRSHGRRHAGSEWAQEFADRLIQAATPDTVRIFRVSRVACDPSGGAPTYLVHFYSGTRSTFALLHFLEAEVVLFDAEEPIGTIRMDDRADTLWARLAALLGHDPLLRASRPEPSTREAPPSPDSIYIFVDELPEVLKRVAPDYPEAARLDFISGQVSVQALVGENGNVRDAFVVNGPDQLRDAALEAVWQWKFKPASMKKQPVAVWVGIPVKFSLH